MAEVDWSNAAWDTIPAYRLSKETVDSFLQGLFGYYNFYTQLSTDYWQFWIPYKLTQAQRTQLIERRTRSPIEDLGQQPDFQPSIQSFLSFLDRSSSFEVIEPAPAPESLDGPILTSFTVRDKVREYLEGNDQERLKQIIADLFPRGDVIWPNDILPNNISVFCTLLKISRGRWIKHFRHHESLSDAKLPFDPKSHPPNWPEDTGDPDFLKKFCEEQWKYCVPVFRQPFVDKHFPKQTILPIVYKKSLSSGGSATLWLIRLHPAYNKLLSEEEKVRLKDSADTFVLKTYITAAAATTYAREVEEFRRLQQKGGDTGIIGFHGSFTRGDEHHVLLEYDDKATLEEYFKNKTPPVDPEEIINFWEALFKILDALSRIHRANTDGAGGPYIGWHQDVKPENILVVSNGSTNYNAWQFKLADLGTSHFERVDASRQDSKASHSYGTRTYAAPEYYRPDGASVRDKLQVGQNADIWSLGCVYSEAARWVKHHYKGVLQYRNERKDEISKIAAFQDADCFHDGSKVLSAVRESHRKSTTNLRTEDYITRVVVDRMITNMLDVAPARPTAAYLWFISKGFVSDARNQLQLATFPPSDSGYASKTSRGAVQGKTIIKGRDENTEDWDAGSVTSLKSRATDLTMSSVNPAGPAGAAEQFAEVLLLDSEIRTLLEEGFQTMELVRFERNFGRLLKDYAASLRREAKDTLEKGATKIVHTYRTYVTRLICSRILGSESESQALAFHDIKSQESSKITLERFLEQYQAPKHDKTIEETRENSNSEAGSNFSDGEQPHLRNLEKVTDFLVSSAAFGAFKQALCSFVRPKSGLQACTTQVESSLSPYKDYSTPKDINVPSSASSSIMGSPHSIHGHIVPGPEYGPGLTPSIVGYNGYGHKPYTFQASGMDDFTLEFNTAKSNANSFVGECKTISTSTPRQHGSISSLSPNHEPLASHASRKHILELDDTIETPPTMLKTEQVGVKKKQRSLEEVSSQIEDDVDMLDAEEDCTLAFYSAAPSPTPSEETADKVDNSDSDMKIHNYPERPQGLSEESMDIMSPQPSTRGLPPEFLFQPNEDETLLEPSEIPFQSLDNNSKSLQKSHSPTTVGSEQAMPQSVSGENPFSGPLELQDMQKFIPNIRSRIKNKIKKLLRPPVAAGFERAEWICDCGDALYVDFNKKNIERMTALTYNLQNRPSNSLPSNNDSDPGEQVRQPSVPTAAYMRHTAGSSTSTGRSVSKDASNPSPTSTLLGSLSTSSILDPTYSTPTFFELCVNAGMFVKSLAEIDLRAVRSDREFFQAVKEHYFRLRSYRSRFWLLRPTSVSYVRFSVEERSRVGLLQKPGTVALPPKSEVDAKRYVYNPCPLDDDELPIPSDLFLHYLLHCAAPSRKLAWLPRIPRKLATSIFTEHGPISFGWGVHIDEGPDFLKISLLNLGVLVVSGGAALLWKYLEHDFQGAFGFACWILAVLNTVMVVLVAQWRRE